jgi:hypothetical protein
LRHYPDEVRQEDREAAYELADDFDGRSVGEFLASIAPQAFARHASPLRTRIAELEGALSNARGNLVRALASSLATSDEFAAMLPSVKIIDATLNGEKKHG